MSEPNPLSKHIGLCAILAIRVCMDMHFKFPPEILDYSGIYVFQRTMIWDTLILILNTI